MNKLKDLLKMPPEKTVFKIYHEILQGNMTDFFLYLAIEILLYFPMMINWLTNGDGSATSFLFKEGHRWEITLGRFGIPFVDGLRNNVIFPAGITVACLILLDITVILICRLFEIESRLYKILMGLLLVASPVVSNTLTYYYCSDSYFLSYLLAVLAVCLFARYSSFITWAGGVICLCVSLSLYQAYIGVTMTLCLIFLLYQILVRNQRVGGYLIRMITGGGISVFLYLLFFKLLQKAGGFVAASSRGFDKMGSIRISEVPIRLIQAYKDVYHYFFTNDIVNNTWWHRREINCSFWLLLFVCVLYFVVKKKLFHLRELLLIVAGIILLPVGLGCMAVLAPEVLLTDETGLLMIMQMNYLYLFVILLIRHIAGGSVAENLLRWLGFVLSAGMILLLLVYTNIFEHCLQLNLNKSYSVGSRMVTRIEEHEQYDGKNTKIMVGGTMERGNYPLAQEELYEITKGSVACYTMFWDSGMQSECWAGFMRVYLGSEFQYVDSGEQKELLQTKEYMEMPIFPEEGSIREIEGVLVIKLSD